MLGENLVEGEDKAEKVWALPTMLPTWTVGNILSHLTGNALLKRGAVERSLEPGFRQTHPTDFDALAAAIDCDASIDIPPDTAFFCFSGLITAGDGEHNCLILGDRNRAVHLLKMKCVMI